MIDMWTAMVAITGLVVLGGLAVVAIAALSWQRMKFDAQLHGSARDHDFRELRLLRGTPKPLSFLAWSPSVGMMTLFA
jgi:hypothetical protein